ncbi:hypothetical protein BC831DRAFT_483316 [Entophlyctis helioformis]|nr:hypothetical protein BC831DRAFT_483316 [Entophlyctis helioformis]
MHQAVPVFEAAFPGLEVSAVYAPGMGGHVYEETGAILGFYPTEAVVELPVFERLSRAEEERLGSAGIRKKPVGLLRVTGECRYGCANVALQSMALFSLASLERDGQLDRSHPIWTWSKPATAPKSPGTGRR